MIFSQVICYFFFTLQNFNVPFQASLLNHVNTLRNHWVTQRLKNTASHRERVSCFIFRWKCKFLCDVICQSDPDMLFARLRWIIDKVRRCPLAPQFVDGYEYCIGSELNNNSRYLCIKQGVRPVVGRTWPTGRMLPLPELDPTTDKLCYSELYGTTNICSLYTKLYIWDKRNFQI